MPTETTPDRHTELAANRTAEAAERTKETAVRTTVAAQRTEASADRRTELAANRTVLAAERTYAAWVRTGLMSLAAGVGAKKTLGGVLPEWVVVVAGSVLVAFAAFCFAAAVWRELYPGTPPPRPDVRRLPRALLFALNGFLALVALAALLGVWFGRTGGTDHCHRPPGTASGAVAANDSRNGRYRRAKATPQERPPTTASTWLEHSGGAAEAG